jgi:hypothetical protein
VLATVPTTDLKTRAFSLAAAVCCCWFMDYLRLYVGLIERAPDGEVSPAARSDPHLLPSDTLMKKRKPDAAFPGVPLTRAADPAADVSEC